MIFAHRRKDAEKTIRVFRFAEKTLTLVQIGFYNKEPEAIEEARIIGIDGKFMTEDLVCVQDNGESVSMDFESPKVFVEPAGSIGFQVLLHTEDLASAKYSCKIGVRGVEAKVYETQFFFLDVS